MLADRLKGFIALKSGLTALILGALTNLLWTFPAVGQPLTITSTIPEEDAVGVPLNEKIVFELNKPLPSFGSAFVSKFFWSPLEKAQLTTFGHDFDENGELTLAFFTLNHAPQTDFAFIVYGIEAADGSLMERPFVLNYSTAASSGTKNVSGTVNFGERTYGKLDQGALAQKLQRAVLRTRLKASLIPSRFGSHVSTSGSSKQAGVITMASYGKQDIHRTVVLLLSQYELNQEFWDVRKAAVVDDFGNFTFNHVREGSYYPVAINYADDSGEAIGSFGFYDSNGDLEPDAITVGGDNLSDIDLTLFDLAPITARSYVDLAHEVVERLAPGQDQELIDIKALRGPSLGTSFPDGTARVWRYTFFSPSQNLLTYLALDPINFSYDQESSEGVEAPLPIPDMFIDSDQALDIANQQGGLAFRSQYPDQDVRISIQGGDLNLSLRPPSPSVFWSIHFQAPVGSASDEFLIFLDMISGEVLEPIVVSSEMPFDIPVASNIVSNYPNPFITSTSIHIKLSEAGHASLEVFNILGKEIGTLIDKELPVGEHIILWNAAAMSPGIYYVRLLVGDKYIYHPMVQVK